MNRYIHDHCKRTYEVPSGTLLSAFVKKNHMVPLKNQQQKPDPTVVDLRINRGDTALTKMLVFTSYMLQERSVGGRPA